MTKRGSFDPPTSWPPLTIVSRPYAHTFEARESALLNALLYVNNICGYKIGDLHFAKYIIRCSQTWRWSTCACMNLVSLQGFTSNATPHDCNTTNLVAIVGSYCNLSVKWLQYVPTMQRTKCVAICVVCRCNRHVLLQPSKNCVAISWHYCHGALELH
jgi:hypothetical protein